MKLKSEEVKADVVSCAPTVSRRHSRRASAIRVGVDVGPHAVMRLLSRGQSGGVER